MNTKHLILTGAYGVLGSNLLKFFPDSWKITKIKFNEIPKGLESADYIIHAAGYGQPLKFTQQPIETLSVNTTTTIELFKYLKPEGTFLFLSTSEIYSGLTFPPFNEDQIGTTTPQHPRSCYIEAKRCGEAICNVYRNQGVDAKVARLSLGYGGGSKEGDTRAMYQFIEQALTSGKIRLLDSGNANRTYCYIDDVCKMIMAILVQGKEGVYNVGGFSTVTIAALARKIGEITGAEVNVPKDKEFLVDAPEDVRLDMTKTLEEFRLRAKDFVSLDDGLRKTINWMKENLYKNE